MRGKFIVLEGIDGAGKSTQLSLLADFLRAEGRRVVVSAEPTDSVYGKMLRAALSGEGEHSPCEMAALFTLDRICHGREIEAVLESGADLLCDRYYYSTLAYQGSMTDYGWVKALNLACPEIPKPDLCLFLDLSSAESYARIAARGEKTELYETPETLGAVREKFLSVISDLEGKERIAVIDTTGLDIEAVANKIRESLAHFAI